MLMHSAMSTPFAAAAARSTSVSGLKAMPTPRPRSRACAAARRVVDGLHVERDAVAAGRPDALEVLFGPRDHEVAVEHSSPLVHEGGDRAQHDRADGDLADEVAVADVEVEDAGSGIEQRSQLLAETGEVRGVDRRLDDARPCPLCPGHPLTVSR